MELSLDLIEAECAEDAHEPLTLRIDDDTTIDLPGPADLPADVILKGVDPVSQMRAMLGDDGFDHLLSLTRPDGRKRVTISAITKIMDHYARHYGLPNPGEGVASPNFSNRAARRSKPTSGSPQTAAAS